MIRVSSINWKGRVLRWFEVDSNLHDQRFPFPLAQCLAPEGAGGGSLPKFGNELAGLSGILV